jgi:peptidoglycan/xylan/chitin deacetylase (PgdA/CDA1 family)
MPPRDQASVLLFWDYDTQWAGDVSRSGKGPQDWANEFENTERLLEMMHAYEMKSCIAVVGSAALSGERPYHDPKQVRAIHDAGHEVASHTHRHEWIPGLSHKQLIETLRSSKDTLEQCIGANVSCLVPPYNQPFDYLRALSISLAERREAGKGRIDLPALCEALRETGYKFCRVGYRSLSARIGDKIRGQRIYQPSQVEIIRGVVCFRTNSCGFAPSAMSVLDRCLETKKTLVIYGHPHSLTNPKDPQRFELLEGFLKRIRELRKEGRIRVMLPREVVAEQTAVSRDGGVRSQE